MNSRVVIIGLAAVVLFGGAALAAVRPDPTPPVDDAAFPYHLVVDATPARPLTPEDQAEIFELAPMVDAPAVAAVAPEITPEIVPLSPPSALALRLDQLKAERAARLADGRLKPVFRPAVTGFGAIKAGRTNSSIAGKDDRRCLAEAVYFEARGESLQGRQAVAQVVLNRLSDAGYPGDVCGVVYERLPGARTCQFSFTCDGSMAGHTLNARAWAEAEAVADEALSGAFGGLTRATHYHSDAVRPVWRHAFDKITTIGRHIFYDGRGDRLAA